MNHRSMRNFLRESISRACTKHIPSASAALSAASLPVQSALQSTLHMAQDSYAGFMMLMRSSVNLVGVTAVLVAIVLMTQPQLRKSLHQLVRMEVRDDKQAADADALLDQAIVQRFNGNARVDAAQTTSLLGLKGSLINTSTLAPSADDAGEIGEIKTDLNKSQKGIARYLARKYQVNQTAVDLIVNAAYLTGKEVDLDPALLLAVMAIESRFNPFAQSSAGAQGLMQVMAKVHADKLDDFGGSNAALNPITNLQVGAVILKDCIRRGGSVAAGLRLYVGTGLSEDDGYGIKVLQEKDRIVMASRGINVLAIAVAANAGAGKVIAPSQPVDAGQTGDHAQAPLAPAHHQESTAAPHQDQV